MSPQKVAQPLSRKSIEVWQEKCNRAHVSRLSLMPIFGPLSLPEILHQHRLKSQIEDGGDFSHEISFKIDPGRQLGRDHDGRSENWVADHVANRIASVNHKRFATLARGDHGMSRGLQERSGKNNRWHSLGPGSRMPEYPSPGSIRTAPA